MARATRRLSESSSVSARMAARQCEWRERLVALGSSPSARQPCRGGLEFCGKKRSNRAATTPCLSADASDTSPATARSVEVGHRSSKLAGSPSRKMSARRRTRSDGVPSVARPTAKSASATVPSAQARRRRPHVSSASTATLCGRRGEDLTGWWPHGFFLGGVDGLGVDGSGSEHRNSVSSSWMAETELGDGTRCLTRLARSSILPRPLDCSVGPPCGCILPLPLDCSMRSIARPRSRPRGAFDRRAALAAGSCTRTKCQSGIGAPIGNVGLQGMCASPPRFVTVARNSKAKLSQRGTGGVFRRCQSSGTSEGTRGFRELRKRTSVRGS